MTGNSEHVASWREGILESFSLSGKKALVTGASSGIGASLARALAEAGAEVICHGNSKPAEATAADLRGQGWKASSVQQNLEEESGAPHLMEKVEAAHGAVDILINNAGMILRHDAEEYPLEDWSKVLQVNLTSVFQLSQLAARPMLAKGFGRILNIASLLSFQGGIRVPAYAASKGGVAQLTKALANEWAARGVTVNAIAPGYIRTENTAALQQDETRNRQILERIPAGRWGEPEDLSGLAVLLASRAGAYITGGVFNVDGGWLGR
ncbi:MAG: SDR family oxidoreductase [Acidobacteriaceae bacterium]|nr:SDR family oxidoreductase [Acidobacteriaceae bacterium]